MADDTDDLFFDTTHLLQDINRRSVRGGAITVISTGARFILTTTSTAVLARLLTPEDFGLVAMVAALTGFVSLFKDLGLSAATVQTPKITHSQISSLFWINVLLSVGIFLLCALSAPAIVWFYGEPRLFWVVIAVSCTFIAGGLTSQHAAILTRQMRYTALALISIIALSASIVVGITMALVGAKYWSLVAMGAAQSVSVAVGVWIAAGWMPQTPRQPKGIGKMLKFGGNLTGFGVLDFCTRNLDNILIGSFLGAAPLGIYSKAYNILMMPLYQFNGPIGSVAQPALCRLQDDPVAYKRYYLKAVGTLAFFGMPLVAFTFVRADDIVVILLGGKWMAAVPIYRALTPAAFVGTISSAPGWLCTSLGYPERQLRWALVSTPIIVAGFAVGLHWGTVGVATGFSLTWCWLFILFFAASCRDSPVRFLNILRVILPATLSSCAAGFATFSITTLLSLGIPFSRLSIDIAVFGLTYIIAFGVLPEGRQTLFGLFTMSAHLGRRRSKDSIEFKSRLTGKV